MYLCLLASYSITIKTIRIRWGLKECSLSLGLSSKIITIQIAARILSRCGVVAVVIGRICDVSFILGTAGVRCGVYSKHSLTRH